MSGVVVTPLILEMTQNALVPMSGREWEVKRSYAGSDGKSRRCNGMPEQNMLEVGAFGHSNNLWACAHVCLQSGQSSSLEAPLALVSSA